MADNRDDTPFESPVLTPSMMSILEREQSMKESLLKKIQDKNIRVVALLARKKRENDMRKKERKAEDFYKKAFIEQIKNRNELKRQETMRKIMERERRAEELLREQREEHTMHGRQHVVEIRDRRIIGRASYRSRKSVSNKELGRNMSSKIIGSTNRKSVSNRELRRRIPSQRNSAHNKDARDDSEIEASAENETHGLLSLEDIGATWTATDLDGSIESDTIDNAYEEVTTNNGCNKPANEEIVTTIVHHMNIGPDFEEFTNIENKVIEMEGIVRAQNATIEELRGMIYSWRLKTILIILASAFVTNRAGRKETKTMLMNSVHNLPTLLSMCFDSQSS